MSFIELPPRLKARESPNGSSRSIKFDWQARCPVFAAQDTRSLSNDPSLGHRAVVGAEARHSSYRIDDRLNRVERSFALEVPRENAARWAQAGVRKMKLELFTGFAIIGVALHFLVAPLLTERRKKLQNTYRRRKNKAGTAKPR
jgi:hypothetical protein